MFIAMNRFLITSGMEGTFIEHWKNRNSYLNEVPGFREFHLLHGPETEKGTVFISHSTWESEQAFIDWTHSEAFRKAHAEAGKKQHDGPCLFQGPPRLETFHAVL